MGDSCGRFRGVGRPGPTASPGVPEAGGLAQIRRRRPARAAASPAQGNASLDRRGRQQVENRVVLCIAVAGGLFRRGQVSPAPENSNDALAQALDE